MEAAALDTNMLFNAITEPRGAATGSMRILIARMYQRLSPANVFLAVFDVRALTVQRY